MISVDEAKARVLTALSALPARDMPVIEASGLAVGTPIDSPIDLPPFTNSAMDGFAVRSAELERATRETPVRLQVTGRILAGEAGSVIAPPNSAVRIMTGAAIPAGYDAVIPFEEIEQVGPDVVLVVRPVRIGANIRSQGEDLRVGDRVVGAGDPLTPARIGLLAAAGVERVPVRPRPKVAILSTGDELVSNGTDHLAPARIHDSNGPMLAALVSQAGGEVQGISRVNDDLPALRAWLAELAEVDLIISSGGISAGDTDYIRDLLTDDLAIEFWQVAMKPGKPFAFGRFGTIPWVALPGNPVAAAVAFWQFGWPAVRTLGGHREIDLPTIPVRLLERIENRGGRRSFVRVRVEFTPEGPVARSAGKPGSAMLASLTEANALLIVPEEVEVADPGTILTAQLIDG